MSFDLAFNDWLERNLTDEIRSTAEEWHDGRSSAMYRLHASSFREDIDPVKSIADFKKLKDETDDCLTKLVDHQHFSSLTALKVFAENALTILRVFEQMEQGAGILAALGVSDVGMIGAKIVFSGTQSKMANSSENAGNSKEELRLQLEEKRFGLKRGMGEAKDHVLMTPLSSMGLPARASNSFHHSDFRFLYEIVQISVRDLMHTPNFGPKSIEELNRAIASLDETLFLGMELPQWIIEECEGAKYLIPAAATGLKI